MAGRLVLDDGEVLGRLHVDEARIAAIEPDATVSAEALVVPGFNDSGAHLTNMAFYDCNLRALQLASADGDEGVAYMVRRLTRDPAAFFGIPAGRIDPGAGYAFCAAHAARLSPPIGWTLTDRRKPMARLFAVPA